MWVWVGGFDLFGGVVLFWEIGFGFVVGLDFAVVVGVGWLLGFRVSLGFLGLGFVLFCFIDLVVLG